MRRKIREQLARQKARERLQGPGGPFAFWRSKPGAVIQVPWTRGQRKWHNAKVKVLMNAFIADMVRGAAPSPTIEE